MVHFEITRWIIGSRRLRTNQRDFHDEIIFPFSFVVCILFFIFIDTHGMNSGTKFVMELHLVFQGQFTR